MPKPTTTLWPLEPHSVAKHIILRKYLNAWLPIMSQQEAKERLRGRGKLVLVDGFCGPGRYEGGEEGSPLIMLNTFLEHSRRNLITADLIYLFIDEDPDRTAHLEGEIAKLDLPPQLKYQIVTGRYEDVFSETLDSVQTPGKTLAPTFAFIDPFGYSEASMGLTDRLLQFDRCEALIYMPLRFIARFVGMPKQETAMTNLFGTDRYKEAIPLSGDARTQFLHDLFRDQLRAESGGRLVRSFQVAGSSGQGYYLFFTTGHLKGIEAMKNAMWAADPEGGERFQDSTDSDQLVIFGELDTTPLLNALRAEFGTKRFTIEQATRFTLVDTAFKKGHLKQKTLAPAEREGLLEPCSTRKRNHTYPDGVVLRFTK